MEAALIQTNLLNQEINNKFDYMRSELKDAKTKIEQQEKEV